MRPSHKKDLPSRQQKRDKEGVLSQHTPLCMQTEPPPPEGGGVDGRLKSPEVRAGDSGNHSVTLKSASSWGSTPWSAMYFAMTSSVTLPLVATK